MSLKTENCNSFNDPERWTGGQVEALMLARACDFNKGVDIFNTIWSQPHLKGPYRSNKKPTEAQNIATKPLFNHDGCEVFYGIYEHIDHHRLNFIHTTLFDEFGLWVYMGLEFRVYGLWV